MKIRLWSRLVEDFYQQISASATTCSLESYIDQVVLPSLLVRHQRKPVPLSRFLSSPLQQSWHQRFFSIAPVHTTELSQFLRHLHSSHKLQAQSGGQFLFSSSQWRNSDYKTNWIETLRVWAQSRVCSCKSPNTYRLCKEWLNEPGLYRQWLTM